LPQFSERGSNKARRDLERKIEETDGRLQETVERLTRAYPPHLVGEAARDDLLDLRPHLQKALAALENIEGQRRLTEKELARRRAFRMLISTDTLP
jgi:hypothetical protein